jgi:ribosomal protein S9
MAQVPNQEGTVAITVNGQNFPKNVSAEIPEPFQVTNVDRISDTQVNVTATGGGGTAKLLGNGLIG